MLEQIFHELNAAHFQSELPLPKLSWNSRLSSSAGRFCSGSRRFLFERPPEIEVATYLRDLPDGDMHIRDTVLHEMIHYFLWHQKKPFGHTPEFNAILKRVGARRYNTVPKERPFKHWYECPSCLKRVPARRRISTSACAACCRRFSGGKFDGRFILLPVNPKDFAPAPPVKQANAVEAAEAVEEPRLPASEVIRRLEELKAMLRARKSPSENPR